MTSCKVLYEASTQKSKRNNVGETGVTKCLRQVRMVECENGLLSLILTLKDEDFLQNYPHDIIIFKT